MKFFSDHLEYVRYTIAKPIKKPCIYIHFNPSDNGTDADKAMVEKNARFLYRVRNEQKRMDLVASLCLGEFVLLVCKDRAEQQAIYKEIDGEDTRGNIYALTFNARGRSENENS